MTDLALRLKDELSRLCEDDRLELANFLWDSLEDEQTGQKEEGYDEAWEAELNRRTQEIESGTAVGRPAKEVFDELRKKYS
jgi:putative addiction module component (TIGR02574 family)